MTRTSLETHKLDMMAEISSLKIKLASADKDRRDLDDRLRITQVLISINRTYLMKNGVPKLYTVNSTGVNIGEKKCTTNFIFSNVQLSLSVAEVIKNKKRLV